jgi:hypothetical protein
MPIDGERFHGRAYMRQAAVGERIKRFDGGTINQDSEIAPR